MEQLDVTGLPPEDVNMLRKLLEFLKAKAATEPAAESVRYRTWPLGVKEPITRAEIYDDLR